MILSEKVPFCQIKSSQSKQKNTVRQSLLERSAESIEKRYHKKNINKDFLFVNLKTHNKNLAR